MSTAPAKSQPNFKSDFLFVTHEPKNVSRVKERRSHAVREHFRKRRWQKANDPLPLRHDYPWTQRLPPGRERPLITKNPPSSEKRVERPEAIALPYQDHSGTQQASQYPRGLHTKSLAGSSKPISDTPYSEYLGSTSPATTTSLPGTSVEIDDLALVTSPSSPSALDPFSSMSVDFATTEDTLISHFLVQPNISWGIDTSKIFSLHRDVIFPAAVHYPATMLTTLLYASMIKDRVTGTGLSQATMQLWKKSVVSVSNRIRDPKTRHTGTLISGVATILLMEDLTGRTANLVQHFSGYKQMLRLRGGWEGFRANNEHLEDLVVTVQAILLAKREMSMLSCVDPNDSNGLLELWEFYQSCNDFAAKLHGFRELLKQENSANMIFAKSHYTVATLFARDNLLLQRLRHALVTGFRGPWFVENVDSQVWFIIMWMALALWDYREDPGKCRAVFGKLIEEPFRTPIKNLRSTHGLSWLFVSQIDEVPERRWAATNMVRVLHRLRPTSRTKVLERSMEMLELRPGNMLGEAFTRQEVEQMRNEALEGLPFRFNR